MSHRLSGEDVRQVALTTPTGFLGFGLGSGLSPAAPGTMGTVVGMLLWLPLVHLPFWLALSLVLGLFVLGIWICQRCSNALGVHDHGGIVWDEMVGIWLVLVCMPFDWRAWLAAFVVFRLFDILKPWPIGWLDRRVSGGFGIMLDDGIAALYAIAAIGICAQGIAHLGA
ncbi:MAG: phosphatidylglycerophosphatase A [Pseudomonadota bacterium]